MTKTKTSVLCLMSAVIPVLALYFGGAFPDKHVSGVAVTVNGPKTANIGDLVEYQSTLNVWPWGLSQVVYQWQVLQGEKSVPYRQLANGDILLSSSSAGKYHIITAATAYYNWFLWHDVVPLGVTVSETTIGTPTPTPTPNPTPTPGPLTGKFWAIGIFDFTKLNTLPATQQSLFTSITARPSIVALGGEWAKFDVNDPKEQNATWMAAGKKQGVPALVVVDAGGNVIHVGVLPTSESDLTNTLQKLKGGTL